MMKKKITERDIGLKDGKDISLSHLKGKYDQKMPEVPLEFNHHDFEFNGSMVIHLPKENVRWYPKMEDVIYAMKDGEIRGVTYPMYFAPTDKYLFNLMIFANQEVDVVELKYWSYGHNELYSLGVQEFSDNMRLGTPISPVELGKV
ncbi:MAG: hypothetical protein HOG49_30300 [Candidatus Scalindua sp.]|mgnify:FL=1|uniref:Uncharacterized protein n=1 Tax=uncultured marine virus TaxID=186617 RepID=A0A0F7L5K5_9VIRU|nr:hypothetical protein [uncultured marine virus]MBT6051112.1 hypothetical protein [Candidatus Scalindua sp.]